MGREVEKEKRKGKEASEGCVKERTTAGGHGGSRPPEPCLRMCNVPELCHNQRLTVFFFPFPLDSTFGL